MILTVATYNIHRGIGIDQHNDLPRVADVIREIDADIVGLQEVVCGKTQLERLMHLMPEYVVTPGPTVERRDGYFGNAMLTRNLHVKATRSSELTVIRREPRRALDMILNFNGHEIRAIVTHLGLRAHERLAQTKILIGALEGEVRDLVLLMADFNEWNPFSRSLHYLDEWFGGGYALRSYPSYFPLFALDQVRVKPFGAMVNAFVHKSKLSRVASDHLPVVIEVDLER